MAGILHFETVLFKGILTFPLYPENILLLERAWKQNAESADAAFRLGITQMA